MGFMDFLAIAQDKVADKIDKMSDEEIDNTFCKSGKTVDDIRKEADRFHELSNRHKNKNN